MTESMRTILLVEDEQNDVDLTLRALEKSNLANDIAVVNDGAEALDYLSGRGKFADRNREEMPAVVLLDLNLPKISGLQVLQRLRAEERTRLLPVVILTSSIEEQDLIDSYKFGANSYVQKPVDFTRFTKAVTELGLYWLLLNESLPRPRKK